MENPDQPPPNPRSINPHLVFLKYSQGRHRVFKSGPGGETIECRRHERRESTRGGLNIIPPLVRGVWGFPPRNLSAYLCVFIGFFYTFGNRFQSQFCAKIYFLASEKPNAGQNSFQTVTILFYIFLQHVCLKLFHLCSRRLWQSTFSTDP